jgi:hypothetical protein
MGSLTEIYVYGLNESREMNLIQHLGTETEPTFLVMGPVHVAVGFSNVVHFYSTRDFTVNTTVKPLPVAIRQYNFNVKTICLNSEFAADLSGTQIFLHNVSLLRSIYFRVPLTFR